MEEERVKKAEPKKERVFDASAFQRAFERSTPTDASAVKGGEVIKRRALEFEMDTSELCPGVFDPPDVLVSLRALSSAKEVEVTRGATDPLSVVHVLARASIEAVNGAPVVGAQLEWFWEVIGSEGRQLIELMYQEIGSLSPATAGKARSSMRLK